jgi:hypothetical protein
MFNNQIETKIMAHLYAPLFLIQTHSLIKLRVAKYPPRHSSSAPNLARVSDDWL